MPRLPQSDKTNSNISNREGYEEINNSNPVPCPDPEWARTGVHGKLGSHYGRCPHWRKLGWSDRRVHWRQQLRSERWPLWPRHRKHRRDYRWRSDRERTDSVEIRIDRGGRPHLRSMGSLRLETQEIVIGIVILHLVEIV